MNVDVTVLFAITAYGAAQAAVAYLVSRMACRRFSAQDETDRRLSKRIDALEQKQEGQP